MNCRPGDLAVIVRDPHCGGVDIGKIVEVVEQGIERDCWACMSLGGRLTAINAVTEWDGLYDIPDSYLRPLGRPDDAIADAREVATCN